jgi:hypothetical protein
MRAVDEATVIGHIVQRLTVNFPDVPPDQVARAVQGALVRFEHSTIREYVPLFVERRAKDELSTLGAAGRHRRETVA